MAFIARCITLLLLIVGIALSIGVFPFRSFPLTIAENLGGYLLPLAAFGLLTIWWWGRVVSFVAALMVAVSLLAGVAVHLSMLRAFFQGVIPFQETYSDSQVVSATRAHVSEAQTMSVALLNVSSENSAPNLVETTVRQMEADLVALFETTEVQVEHLRDAFPYRVFVHQVEGKGIALLSRFPVTALQTDIGAEVRPVLIAEVAPSPSHKLPVLVFDALPPFSDADVHAAWVTVRRLATMLRHDYPEALVLTDLNATPFSRLYRTLVGEGRLKDVQWGRGLSGVGLSRTWDTGRWWMRFTIDYILYKGQVRPRGLQVFAIPGSDHQGLLSVLEVGDTG